MTNAASFEVLEVPDETTGSLMVKRRPAPHRVGCIGLILWAMGSLGPAHADILVADWADVATEISIDGVNTIRAMALVTAL